LFKVKHIHEDKIYMVYSIRTISITMEIGENIVNHEFLLFKNGKWLYDSAENYLPLGD
jgi:hypothetical protein